MTKHEMLAWHHQLDGHEFEQALGVGDRQRSLACCSPWGHKESDTTELNLDLFSPQNSYFHSTPTPGMVFSYNTQFMLECLLLRTLTCLLTKISTYIENFVSFMDISLCVIFFS